MPKEAGGFHLSELLRSSKLRLRFQVERFGCGHPNISGRLCCPSCSTSNNTNSTKESPAPEKRLQSTVMRLEIKGK